MGASRIRAIGACCAAVVLAMWGGRASGQAVLTGGDFPSDWVFPFAPGSIDNPATRINQGNVTGANGSNFTVGDTYRDVRLQGTATVTEDGNAVRDRYSFQLGANQDFEISDANGANVWAPLYTRGAISFVQNAVAPNANFAIGSITAQVQLMRWNGASYVALNSPSLGVNALPAAKTASSTLSRDAQVNPAGGNLDEIQMLRYDDAPAAKYELQIRLTITGEADAGFARNSNNGSGETSNALAAAATDRYTGALTGLGYSPSTAAALPDSRAVVHAPEARAQYGVDGTGSTIGLLEPGRVIDTHTDFAGGKVTQLRQRLDQAAGLTNLADANTRVADGRSEHTTAVAGIAAGSAGNDSQMGIAPGASLVSVAVAAYADDAAGPGAKTSGQKQFEALLGAGSTVINMSAAYGDLTPAYIDGVMAANTRVTFVKSAGNSNIAAGGANTITQPGMSYNTIAVGAVNQQMTRTADFSSTNNTDGTLRKPDLVAPGEYVVIPNAIDTNNDGMVNDFDRRFTGSDGRYMDSSATTGGAKGTSFAAPHVAGAVALLQDYARRDPINYNADSVDQRVMKAVLLNTADRKVVGHDDGSKWTQVSAVAGGVTTVTESLDRQLGAGLLNAQGALKNFAAGEIDFNDHPASAHEKIKDTGGADIIRPARTEFWDLMGVSPSEVGPPPGGGSPQPGTVDYILGSKAVINYRAEDNTFTGMVMPQFRTLSACLDWDRTTTGGAYDPLAKLELRLYLDGLDSGNVAGYDSSNPTADKLLMTTDSSAENVKMLLIDQVYPDSWTYFTAFGSTPPLEWSPKFYLEVTNLAGGGDVDYGLSVSAVLPEPGMGFLGLGVIALMTGRRPGKSRSR